MSSEGRTQIPRLTLKESVVFRLLGLLMLFAPRTGAELLSEIHVRTNETLAERAEREFTDGALRAAAEDWRDA